MRIVFSPERCTGCMACQMACMDQRDIRPGQGETPLCRVTAEERDSDLAFRMDRCLQCGACAAACPTGCLQMEDGLVLAEEQACIGCRRCERACPFEAIQFVDRKAAKCDGCRGRIAEGKLPLCVLACPRQALTVSEKNRVVTDGLNALLGELEAFRRCDDEKSVPPK